MPNLIQYEFSNFILIKSAFLEMNKTDCFFFHLSEEMFVIQKKRVSNLSTSSSVHLKLSHRTTINTFNNGQRTTSVSSIRIPNSLKCGCVNYDAL